MASAKLEMSAKYYNSSIEESVVKLYDEIIRFDKGSTFNPAATVEEINRFQERQELALPPEAKRWFRWHNGANLAVGGLYSLFSSGKDSCSLNWYLDEFPDWKKKGWLPIANDGCGDLYVLTTAITTTATKTHPVFFLDQSDNTPTYIVASGLWKFLSFFFEKEMLIHQDQLSYWPFDKKKVVANDPQIIEFKGISLPWEANDEEG
jgi:cell wall assembly regulator SMI1